jgi:hypothetical protein
VLVADSLMSPNYSVGEVFSYSSWYGVAAALPLWLACAAQSQLVQLSCFCYCWESISHRAVLSSSISIRSSMTSISGTSLFRGDDGLSGARSAYLWHLSKIASCAVCRGLFGTLGKFGLESGLDVIARLVVSNPLHAISGAPSVRVPRLLWSRSLDSRGPQR